MLKPFTMICLATAAVPLAGAFLLAQGAGERSPVRSAPVVLAMQESRPAGAEAAPRGQLAHIGWVGVMLQDNNGHGVKVQGVFPGGPAAFAGVRVGDVLVRIGGTDVNSTQDAESAIERLAPQQSSTLSVERAKKATELKVTAGSLAEFRQDYIREMMRRDPRDPKYGTHHGVSEADVSAELVRRLFEQHERMERALIELTKEVHGLRKQVAALQK
jgi:membrane-associated protease RseP (regulator of RpoE activity)